MFRMMTLVGICLSLGLGPAIPAQGMSAGEALRSLSGRPAFRVMVTPVNRGARTRNITDAKVKNLVRARLEFSGVRVKNRGFPVVLAACECYGRVCFATIEVLQRVSLRRKPSLRVLATTWIVQTAFRYDRFTEGVGRMINRLVTDYRKAR